MTEKEIAEIRRRINIDKCSISDIRGCYVNENKEIIAQFSQFLGTVPKDEAAGLLSIIKKVLSGQQGKNLIDIEFSNQQVIDSDEHNLLMKLRDSELKDDETVAEFYKHVISSLQIEGKYLILLTLDKYDVPSYTKDDIKLEDTDTIFKYLLCAICPVTMTKPALSYAVTEQQFKNIKTDWIISNPEIGFMFPAFDDRQANIYDALYYIKNSSLSYDEFTDEIFNSGAHILTYGIGLDGFSAGRQLIDNRNVHIPVHNQCKGSRNGSCRHDKRMGREAIRPLSRQKPALQNTKAVLLITHGETEPGKAYPILQKRVRSDENVDLTGFRSLDHTPFFGGGSRSENETASDPKGSEQT